MIARLRGTVLEAAAGRVVLDVQGVGYEVFVPDPYLVQVPSPGNDATLVVRQVFREDGTTLYGFLTEDQRRLFDLLIDVQGCGPKVAMALLGTVGDEAIATAIVHEDAKALTAAPGVGPKLGQRLVIELKSKLEKELGERKLMRSISKPQKTKADDDLIEALLGLGYRRQEVESVAEAVREESDDLNEQVRLALRRLAK